MASVVYRNQNYEVTSTNTYSLPVGVTELTVPFEGIDVNFLFLVDEDSERGARVDVKDSRLVFTLTNFNNNIGSAFDSDVGHVDGRRVRMACTVHGIGQGKTGEWPLSVTVTFLKEAAK